MSSHDLSVHHLSAPPGTLGKAWRLFQKLSCKASINPQLGWIPKSPNTFQVNRAIPPPPPHTLQTSIRPSESPGGDCGNTECRPPPQSIPGGWSQERAFPTGLQVVLILLAGTPVWSHCSTETEKSNRATANTKTTLLWGKGKHTTLLPSYQNRECQAGTPCPPADPKPIVFFTLGLAGRRLSPGWAQPRSQAWQVNFLLCGPCFCHLPWCLGHWIYIFFKDY